jgi:hypothetical protein
MTFHDSLFYLRQAEHEASIPTLFDLLATSEKETELA